MFTLITKAMEQAFAEGLCHGWEYEYDPIPDTLMVRANEPKGAGAFAFINAIIQQHGLKAVQFKGAVYIRL